MGLARIIERGCHYYKNRMPLECDYQRCHNMIVEMPFVSKQGAKGMRVRTPCHRYYHIECARILRVI